MLCFPDRLDASIRRCRNPVLVGLDPRMDSLPPSLRPADDFPYRPAQPRTAPFAEA